jgi:hypothetical protein
MSSECYIEPSSTVRPWVPVELATSTSISTPPPTTMHNDGPSCLASAPTALTVSYLLLVADTQH